ncbi:MAG: hypothetical protein WAX77_03815 [Methylococcaceae bacterium]
MKTLNITISDTDFARYNLQQNVLSFDELIAKINAVSLNNSNKKAKFEQTPAFNLWQDRDDMANVDEYVAELRKPRLRDVY